jgi:hypothetical protein
VAARLQRLDDVVGDGALVVRSHDDPHAGKLPAGPRNRGYTPRAPRM